MNWIVALKWFRRSVIFVVGIIVLLALSISIYLWKSAPQVSGSLGVNGLMENVSVARDDKGLVTINAQSENDAYFAMGYIDAQDRLYQMMMLRQLFKGRLSEWVGPKAIDMDKYMRFLGFGRQAKAIGSKGFLKEKTRRAFEQYTAGVNAFIDTQLVPPSLLLIAGSHLEPWAVEDCVLIQKMLAWNLTNNWRDKYANAAINNKFSQSNAINILFPEAQIAESDSDRNALTTIKPEDYRAMGITGALKDYPLAENVNASTKALFDTFMSFENDVLTKLGDDRTRAGGSNIWTISGTKTQNGFPQLANDPHLTLKAPNLFHLSSIQWPGHSISGVNVPGAPIVIIGVTKNIAWGFTNAHGDQSDLFYCDSNCPQVDKQTIKEVIKVKGQDDVTYSFDQVRLFKKNDFEGVIAKSLPGSEGKAFLAWVGFEEQDPTLDVLYELNHATDFNSIANVDAFKRWVAPSQNIMIVGKDKEDIHYQLLGKTPQRVHTGQMPVSLDSSPDEWKEWIKNPFVSKPERGYLINTNNFIAPKNYPYLINGLVYDGLRQQRAVDLISAQKGVHQDDNNTWQTDVRANEWIALSSKIVPEHNKTDHVKSRWLSEGVQSLVDQNNDPVEKKAFAAMIKWDKNPLMLNNEVGPTIFAVWSRLLVNDIYTSLADKMHDEPIDRLVPYSPLFVSNLLAGDASSQALFNEDDPVRNIDSFLYNKFSQTISQLKSAYGDDLSAWQWSKVHQVNFANSLGKNPLFKSWVDRKVSVPGGRDTLNRMRWYRNESDDNRLLFDAKDGASVRMIVDASDFTNTKWMLPMGQSDRAFTSKHYDDLNPLWATGQMMTFIEKGHKVANQLTLVPKS